jgi:hypothetical protein
MNKGRGDFLTSEGTIIFSRSRLIQHVFVNRGLFMVSRYPVVI